MKKVFFTVGPGQLYPSLKRYIDQAYVRDIMSLSHRSNAFSALFKDTKESLFTLLTVPSSYSMFLTGSGLEAMERTAQNVSGVWSTHFVNGSFSTQWAQFSTGLGKKVTRIEVADGNGFELNAIKLPKQTESIFVTLNETSTGVYLGTKFIKALRKSYPDKIIAVDMVSSAPYSNVDFSAIDVALFSVQKGFGLPAGMSVIIASPRALDKARSLVNKKFNIGTYQSFTTLEKMAEKNQTPETPNVLSLYLLNNVLRAMHKKGMGVIRKEIMQRARLMYDTFESRADIHPFVSNKNVRSPTTIVLNTAQDPTMIIKKLENQGVVLSAGYGLHRNNQIRIANYPAHTDAQIARLLKLLTV